MIYHALEYSDPTRYRVNSVLSTCASLIFRSEKHHAAISLLGVPPLPSAEREFTELVPCCFICRRKFSLFTFYTRTCTRHNRFLAKKLIEINVSNVLKICLLSLSLSLSLSEITYMWCLKYYSEIAFQENWIESYLESLFVRCIQRQIILGLMFQYVSLLKTFFIFYICFISHNLVSL